MADRITLTLTKTDGGKDMRIECDPDPGSTWTFAEYCEALSAAAGAASDACGWAK